MTLFFTKNLDFRTKNKFLLKTFLVSSYFASHPITVLLKIFGGTDGWAVPPPHILGDRLPQSPLSLRPCWCVSDESQTLGTGFIVNEPCMPCHHKPVLDNFIHLKFQY